MDATEALQHIRMLIDVARKTEDPKLLHNLLKQMKSIANKASSPPIKVKRAKAKKPAGKVVLFRKTKAE